MAAHAVISPLTEADQAEWRRLWTLYLEFYGATVSEEVYETTFRRLLSGEDNEYEGLIARNTDGQAIGITHFLSHRHCWSVENAVYLQDLYVDESARGTGAGRALVEAVYARADEIGAANVYWLTQNFNHTARRLYDRIGKLTPFIKYQRR